MCDIQTTSKYTSRPSPPYPANVCCGRVMSGNDGQLYKSVPDKNGVCHWKLTKTDVKKEKKSPKRSLKKSFKKSVKTSRRRKKISDILFKRAEDGKVFRRSCKKSTENTREALIKELRCHVRYWERITRRNQDMSLERLRNEPLSFIKKQLKWYRDTDPKDLGW
jgi:hypothetical protein